MWLHGLGRDQVRSEDIDLEPELDSNVCRSTMRVTRKKLGLLP